MDERDISYNPIDHHTVSGSLASLIEVWYTEDGQNTRWTFDTLGNRIRENRYVGFSDITNTTYYPHSSLVKTNGEWQFNYDANGNMVARGKAGTWNASKGSFVWAQDSGELWVYEWDLSNRLVRVSMSKAGGSGLQEAARYRYDSRFLRVQAVKAASTTRFEYNVSGSLIWRSDGDSSTRYLWALGGVWAEVQSDSSSPTPDERKVYWHHVNHQGTSEVITDKDGSIVWDTRLSVYGSVLSANGSIAFTPSYTGKDLDSDTGLYYFNFRWYDAELGRFISEDPARDGVNWYGYCNANPMMFVDPWGLSDVDYATGNRVEYNSSEAKVLSKKFIEILFYVTSIEINDVGGRTAHGYLRVINHDNGKDFTIRDVRSGGIGITNSQKKSNPIPFGNYDLLGPTREGQLYHRLEAHDKNYGDDNVDFDGQAKHSLVRIHGRGSGATYGCISIPDYDASILLKEIETIEPKTITVESKSRNFLKKIENEENTKFGTVSVIDAQKKEEPVLNE